MTTKTIEQEMELIILWTLKRAEVMELITRKLWGL